MNLGLELDSMVEFLKVEEAIWEGNVITYISPYVENLDISSGIHEFFDIVLFREDVPRMDKNFVEYGKETRELMKMLQANKPASKVLVVLKNKNVPLFLQHTSSVIYGSGIGFIKYRYGSVGGANDNFEVFLRCRGIKTTYTMMRELIL